MADKSQDPILNAVEELSTLTEAQHNRVRRALKDEEKAGGGLDPAVSTEVRRTHRMRVDQISILNRLGTPPALAVTPQKRGIVAEILAGVFPQRRKGKAVAKHAREAENPAGSD